MKTKNPEQPKTDFPSSIGNPARSALEHAGYSKLKQLTKVSEAELSQLHGMGPKALGILRQTLQTKGWSFKPGKPGEKVKKKGSPVSRTDKVEEFLQELSHPLKAEVEMVRAIIKGVNKGINEEIKWNAPSFNYEGEYLVTFNLRETKRIHLVFHNPMISKVTNELLEGDYDHRRMAYFSDKKDIQAKSPVLEKAIKDLIKLQKK